MRCESRIWATFGVGKQRRTHYNTEKKRAETFFFCRLVFARVGLWAFTQSSRVECSLPDRADVLCSHCSLDVSSFLSDSFARTGRNEQQDVSTAKFSFSSFRYPTFNQVRKKETSAWFEMNCPPPCLSDVRFLLMPLVGFTSWSPFFYPTSSNDEHLRPSWIALVLFLRAAPCPTTLAHATTMSSEQPWVSPFLATIHLDRIKSPVGH